MEGRKNKGFIIAATGHRTKSLFGEDLMDPRYQLIREAIKKIVKDSSATELWTGMALGTDQLAALAVLDLKAEGYDIRLNAAIPYIGHPDRWPDRQRDLYRAILSRCDRVELVCRTGYSARALDMRNRYMVDRADAIIAVYDGTKGGTANCIRYARDRKKAVWYMHPDDPGNSVYAPAPTRRHAA